MSKLASTQLQPALAALNPVWLRLPQAERYSGLRKSRLYELIAEGEIRSYCLKSRKDSLRGIRLISRESIDDYLNKKAGKAEDYEANAATRASHSEKAPHRHERTRASRESPSGSA